MTLRELITAVDSLSLDDLLRLREHIQQRERERKYQIGTMDIDAILGGIEIMRQGLTENQFNEMIDAMNEEYIEPVDESEWTL